MPFDQAPTQEPPRAGAKPWAWDRAVLIAGLLFHLVLFVSVFRQPLDVNDHPDRRALTWSLYHNSIHRIGPGADFFAVYHAGIAARQGRNPYAQEESPTVTPYFYPYRYLPLMGPTFGRWLTIVAPLASYRLWLVFCELVLGILLWVFWRRWAKLTRVRLGRAITSAALLLSTPYFLELHMGQFTFVMGAFCALAFIWTEPALRRVVGRDAAAETPRSGSGSASRARQAMAGLLFFSASLLKILPLVMLPAVLRRRTLVLAGGVAGLLAVATAYPYFSHHPDQWHTFKELNFGSPIPTMAGGNYSLLFLNLLSGMAIGSVPTVEQFDRMAFLFRIILMTATVVLVLASRNRSVELKASALFLGHFVTYGHIWEHHLSALVVIGCLMLLHLDMHDDGPLPLRDPIENSPSELGEAASTGPETSHRQRRPWAWALTLTALALLVLPTPWPLFDTAKDPSVFDPSRGWSVWTNIGITASKVIPIVLLYAVACVSLFRRSSDHPPVFGTGAAAAGGAPAEDAAAGTAAGAATPGQTASASGQPPLTT
ncbi:MAG: glycosyltransferase family 87 protein [Candidatus Eisenbacteria bacterium]